MRMCHFDDVLDPSGIIYVFLTLLSNGGNVLIHEHRVMEMMWLFPFQMLVWIHWLWHFSCILQSNMVYNIICFILEIKVNLSLCLIKLHILKHMREWRYSTMESKPMTGWWMSPSVWLGAILKLKLPLLVWMEYQPSYEHPGHMFISLHYPGPILIALSCIMSYQFTHIKPVLLVTTNWASMHNFLYLKHRCPATSHIPWHALYNWIQLVHAIASHCTELLQPTSYNKTSVMQSVASHCIKLAVWDHFL